MNLLARKKSKIIGGLPLLPVVLALVFLLAACGGNGMEETAPPATKEMSSGGDSVSFANDVLPIINNRCAKCHGGDRIEKQLNLLSYSTLIAGSENGPVVVPGDADSSKLIELIATQKMPKRGAKLNTVQVQVFTDWVNQGALDN